MRILNFMGADNKITAGTWEGLWYLQTKRGKKVTTRWKGGNVTVCLWWWHLDVIKCHRETRKKNKLFIHHWLASTSYNIFIYSFLKHKPLIKEQLTPKSNIWDWEWSPDVLHSQLPWKVFLLRPDNAIRDDGRRYISPPSFSQFHFWDSVCLFWSKPGGMKKDEKINLHNLIMYWRWIWLCHQGPKLLNCYFYSCEKTWAQMHRTPTQNFSRNEIQKGETKAR